MKLFILFGFLAVLSVMGVGYMHEQVHVVIYKSYGIESKVEYFSAFPDFRTIAEAPCPTEECRLAHHINEAISYPLFIMFTFFLIFAVIIVMQLRLIELKLNQNNNDAQI